jgi:hypothetical protein
VNAKRPSTSDMTLNFPSASSHLDLDLECFIFRVTLHIKVPLGTLTEAILDTLC